MGRLRFDAGDTYIVSGLCNLDAMLETYRLSGDRRILDRVRAAMDAAEVQTAFASGPAASSSPATPSAPTSKSRLARTVRLGHRPAAMPGRLVAGFPLDR